MFKKYIDFDFFNNPLSEYFNWISKKLYYQTKFWGKHLRIGYNSKVSNSIFGKYNCLARNVLMSHTELGDFTYISDGSVVFDAIIGKFCSIGPNVRIAPGKHPTSNFVSTHPSLYSNPGNLLRNFVNKSVYNYNKKVVIGNDVWIGANAVVIEGISIGDGAVIAANSVVTKDVEPYVIVGGVPAKPIKKRFTDAEIKFFINFKWWDKSEAFIQNNITSWWSAADFIEKFK